jgi:hypothetical protein
LDEGKFAGFFEANDPLNCAEMRAFLINVVDPKIDAQFDDLDTYDSRLLAGATLGLGDWDELLDRGEGERERVTLEVRAVSVCRKKLTR